MIRIHSPYRLVMLVGSLALGLVAPVLAMAEDHRDEAERRSILARAAASGKASSFVSAVVVADLAPTLSKNEGNLTVLVPTDEAFAKLPPATRQALLSPGGTEKLQAILKYHVLPRRVLAKQITRDPQPKTLTGETWTVAANEKGIAVNGATVVEADVLAKNGVIHFIDTVLIPPAADLLSVADKVGHLSILVEALKAAGMEEALRRGGPFTIFAPTDEAFQTLGKSTLSALFEKQNQAKLQEILSNHVVVGRLSARAAVVAGEVKTLQGSQLPITIKAGKLMIGASTAVATDLEASDGIIHVIDTLLVPDPKK